MSNENVEVVGIERVSGPTLIVEQIETEIVASDGLITANVRHAGTEVVNPETLEGEIRPMARRRARR